MAKRRRKKRILRHRPGKSAKVRAKAKRRRRRNKRDLWRPQTRFHAQDVLDAMAAVQEILPALRSGLVTMKGALAAMGTSAADVIEHVADRVEREPWMAFDLKLRPEEVPEAREVARRIRLNAHKMMLPDGVSKEV